MQEIWHDFCFRSFTWHPGFDMIKTFAELALCDLNCTWPPQSLATNSPAPWPAASPASAQARDVMKLGHVTSVGKLKCFFSSTGACTATKYLIANRRSPIDAQLYFASVTQMFLMLIFVKVESDSSKLLRTVSKSGPNGCKERSRPQKMFMMIKIESL